MSNVYVVFSTGFYYEHYEDGNRDLYSKVIGIFKNVEDAIKLVNDHDFSYGGDEYYREHIDTIEFDRFTRADVLDVDIDQQTFIYGRAVEYDDDYERVYICIHVREYELQ